MTDTDRSPATGLSQIGLVGLAVMGQNLALNIADKGFPISVYNRTFEKTEAAVDRARKEGLDDKLRGFKEVKDFVASLQKPRCIIILVKAGAPVDQTITHLMDYLEEGDLIIDGGNEWYENTERRRDLVKAKGVRYMGMGVSGGEEGARNGPALMPGGDREAYALIEPVVSKVAAQVDSGPCVTYVGPGGAGNYVKMVHNGIEYGDMQLISEAYDLMKNVGGLTNAELAAEFDEWNRGELNSFLIDISALILKKMDDQEGKSGELLDKVLDKTGMKGTGKWTVQQAAELSIAMPTIEASLDMRFISGLKDDRLAAERFYDSLGLPPAASTRPTLDKKHFVEDVRRALYCSKVCSYAQGYQLIKAKSDEQKWGVDLAELARIWKGGCIIRAQFLDRIRRAYSKDKALPSLLVDPDFGRELVHYNESWRRTVATAVAAGVPVPGMSASLGYFDSYRRGRLPANLVQAQRDFFGSHTYERTDMPGSFHSLWSDRQSKDSITTSSYKA